MKKKWFSVLGVALALATPIVPTQTAAAIDTGVCPSSSTFTCLTRFGYGAGDTGTWSERYYRGGIADAGFHNCTRFAAFYMARFLGYQDPGSSYGAAWNWGLTDAEGGARDRVSLKERGFRVDSTPAVGSIAWWRSGHVGVVIEVGAGYVTIASDNYVPGNGTADVTRRSPGGYYPTGFIHVERGGAGADLNGDGKDDIAWYEPNLGNMLSYFLSNGNGFGITRAGGGIGAPTWAGTGDFNGDGKDDIAWYEPALGNMLSYFLSTGTGFTIVRAAGGIGAPAWAGTGDFNGDGKDDIAWYEPALNNTISYFLSTGTGITIVRAASGIGAPAWAGTGDFNGDGKDDIAWHEPNLGNMLSYFLSTGTGITIVRAAGGIGAPAWAGTGDFNGDGKDDIAWHEPNLGNMLSYFLSTGTGITIVRAAGGIGAPAWAGTGDFNGDGKDDIAWHEPNLGNMLSYFLSTGTGFNIVRAAGGIGAPVWAGNGSFPYTNGNGMNAPRAGRWYEVRNAHTGLCVDARSSGTGNGTVIQQYTCNRTSAQAFQFVPVGNGAFRVLRRGTTNQVLDVTGVSTASGAKIQTWAWVGGANQQWRVEQVGPNTWRLVAVHSGKCLDVPGASTARSVQLQQYACNGTGAQTFVLTPL